MENPEGTHRISCHQHGLYLNDIQLSITFKTDTELRKHWRAYISQNVMQLRYNFELKKEQRKDLPYQHRHPQSRIIACSQ